MFDISIRFIRTHPIINSIFSKDLLYLQFYRFKERNFFSKLCLISKRYFRRRQIAEIYLNFAIAKQNYQSKEKLSLFAKMINNHFSNFLFLSGNIPFFFLILSSNAFSVSALNPFYLRIVLS